MKKITLLTLVAGFIAFAPAFVRADDQKPADNPPAQKLSREELREKLKNMTPEQRREYFQKHQEELRGLRGPGGPGGFGGNAEDMRKRRDEFGKKLGLNPEDLKDLTPEQRQAKMKEAIDKKVTELEKKKTDGTLTDEEKADLDRFSNMKKNMGQWRQRGPGTEKKGQDQKPEKSAEEKKPEDKK